jgi:competence ComEA-like helix-hairpin-helix protein
MEQDPPIRDTRIPPHHAAGAYGFSRNELRGLVIFGLLVSGWIVYQWFERRASGSVPPWIVEDVMVGPSALAGSTVSDPRDPGVNAGSRSRSGDRSDTEDPGHILVDVNTAGRYELLRLPGIGPALAARIIAEREKNGPFANLLDFQRVRGIGPKTAAMLAGWIRFSRTEVPSADTAAQEQ